MGWVLAGCQETWSHALSNNIQMGHNTLASSHRQSFLRETLKGKVNDLNWISYTFFCASKYSQSRISLWQADKLMSQELGDEKIITQANLFNHFRECVERFVDESLLLLLCCYTGVAAQRVTAYCTSRELCFSISFGSLSNPFSSVLENKIRESLLHILWVDWCCSYHKGSPMRIGPSFIILKLWAETPPHSHWHYT